MFLIYLLNYNLRAAGCFAGEQALFDLTKGNGASLCGMDGEVAAHVCTGASQFGCTSLAD